VKSLGPNLPDELTQMDWRRRHSPTEAWVLLVGRGLSENETWDAVAYLWLQDTEPTELQTAASLYAKNCAACHGESGDGDGPGAAALAGQMGQNEMAQSPTAFADPQVMLGGSSDIYYAKIRRGGMGTGMPSFGSIFTPEKTWALVDYLWTFVFETEVQE
jgi:mono/diheme cytochrome c family protein